MFTLIHPEEYEVLKKMTRFALANGFLDTLKTLEELKRVGDIQTTFRF